ncbi:MAG TPA: hypothetical protein VL096_10460, partial [Pirellulaceae bacterium]|nr:hypothetical protein [Pirellulaceae bacterium]
MNKTFFARYALPILMLVFFIVPFALRGARMSFSTMKNDVKDWLPASFEETKDLEWFRDNFLGEQFVLVTWPGCTAEDTRYKLLVEKLRHEVPLDAPLDAPKVASLPLLAAEEDQTEAEAETPPGDDAITAEGSAALADLQSLHARQLERTRLMGDRLGLSTTGQYHENWGGLGERWLQGDKEAWYYITPAGELYRWDGGNNLLGWASRRLERLATGSNRASGELVATVGDKPADGRENEYHADPRKLTARFFKTVTTGPEVLQRLAGPNGGLWPRGDYSDEEKSVIATKIALDRLNGGLF